MLKSSLFAAAILGTTLSGVAQTCTGAPGSRQFSNRAEFGASFYYNLGNYFFDLDAQVPIDISSMLTWTYDSGIGNPPTPNQVGATGVVNVYICPTTRVGNEAIAPTAPGTPWIQLGTGTVTIVGTPGESPITFMPALMFPQGQWGVALEFVPTTNGPNPGPLHCLGVAPNPNAPYEDQFLTMSNDGIQGVSWTGTANDSINLRMTYTPAANSAYFTQFGDGCYFRPQAWYQNFPASATPPDLQNTGLLWLNQGPNYLVVPGPGIIVPQASASLTLVPPTSASSAGVWDDALSDPIMLPFNFPYPGGSTNEITISSNGCVYLDSVISNDYAVCGASYGSIVPFRDGPPRIAAYYHDLDASAGGTIQYDVDPSNNLVRITFTAVPEWPVPTALNTFQITLDATGLVEIAYGVLANTGTANGNNAIAGFTPGNGSRLGPAIDISAEVGMLLGYTSGDGAIPPVLGMDGRPVLGTSPNIVTSNITPGTIVEALAAGDVGLPAPLPLGFVGMPDCFLHINLQILFTGVINGMGEFVQPFPIPNNTSLQGATLVFQAAPVTPGFNSLGLLTSNGMCVRVGL